MDPTTTSSPPRPATLDAPHAMCARLSEEWDDLADRLEAPPFIRPGWIDAWWRAFGAGELEVREARRDGHLAGVLPLIRRGGQLRSPTNAHTPHFGPLAEDAETSRALVAAAVGERRRLRLTHVEPATCADALAAARDAGAPTHAVTMLRSPFLDLEAPGERPKRRFRADLRRRRRRLEEQGRVTFADEAEDPERTLEAGLALEAAGWKGDQRTAVEGRPTLSAFYRDVAAWAAQRGELRLFFLRLDGTPLAFALGLEDDAAIHLLKSGFDPAYAAFSPGQLLIGEIAAAGRAAGRRRLELLGGDEPYKLAWTEAVRARSRVDVFPPTAAGRLARTMLVQRGNAARELPGLAGALRAVRDRAVLPLLEEVGRRRGPTDDGTPPTADGPPTDKERP